MKTDNSIKEQLYALDQRDLIKTIMSELSITRDKLANLINCSRRQIDTWILPESSKERRVINSDHRHAIANILFDHLFEKRLIEQGHLKKLDSAPNGFTSDISGITYPAIYYVKQPVFDYTMTQALEGHEQLEKIEPTGEFYYEHDFTTTTPYYFREFGYEAEFTQVASLGDHTDYWISIVKLKSLAEWSGFFTGFLSSPAAFTSDFNYPSIIRTQHGIFACTRYDCEQSNSHRLKGMIIYSGEYEKNDSSSFSNEDSETVVVLPNGEVIQGDKGEQYIHELYGLED